MKKLILIVTVLILIGSFSLRAEKFPIRHQQTFTEIYDTYPAIPVGLIEAIAYNNTRMRHITVEQDSVSCTEMPRYNGLMGLIDDGKGYFRSSLTLVSDLSGFSKNEILNNPKQSVIAYAAAMNHLLMTKKMATNMSPIDFIPEIISLSELPLTNDIENDFAINSDLYMIFTVLQNEEFRSIYNVPAYDYDLKEVFGANYEVLSATRISAIDGSIVSDEANPYQHTERKAACVMPSGSIEYPIATWDAADPSNYSAASTVNTRELIAIHTIQGKYSGAISWFKNPSANVSTQYVVRSYDGQVTQMACHVTRCWHVAAQNSYSVGIEHEGYIADGNTWYTTELYASSADLVKYIAGAEGVNLLQTYDGPPTDGILSLSNGCHKVKGHQHHEGNSHIDPGPEWEWKRFYRLLNDLPAPTSSSTTSTGTMYDSGGVGGNYANEERTTYLINPSGNGPVQLTFSSYFVEDGWDYLWIYDGLDDTGNLIGKYSGTSPGTITAFTGSVFMEFRSDCATSSAGWVVDWITTTPPTCVPPSGGIATFITPMTADLSWNVVPGATSYKVQYKSTIDSIWSDIITYDLYLDLTGLRSSAEYLWRVMTTCSPDESAYTGGKFTTPGAAETLTATAGKYLTTNCSGEFYDTGGLDSEYGNYQDWTYTIEPLGATSVIVTFTDFDIENGFDYLKIYDGATTSSSLIGSYTGTSSPGTVISSGGAITFHFTSDNWTIAAGWESSWSCSEGAVATAPITSIEVLNNWYTNDFNVSFTDSDNSGTGLQEEFYQVLAHDGIEYRGNADLGFLNDEFENNLHTDWTSQIGNWVATGGVLTQSDEVSNNTNLYASITQGTGIYLYHWQMKIGGSGSNRRAGLHFFCDDPTATVRGNSYMVYYRVDNNTVQIYESDGATIPVMSTTSNTVNADQWYDCKVTYSSTTGEINAYINDELAATWTDPTPMTAANSISLRTGNCNVEYDDVKVYKYRTPSESITVGNLGTESVQYENVSPVIPAVQINTVIVDNTDTWSFESTSYTNIDWTSPLSIIVYDGVSSDIDTTHDATQLIANWTISTDANSDVTNYWYKVGTTAGSDDIKILTDNGNNTLVTISGLNLIAEQIYYVTVAVENGAGLFSNEVSSDGIRLVDVCQKLPSTEVLTSQQWYSNDFTVTFNDNDSCGNGLVYNLCQVLEFDGSEWRGNESHGFFNDNFNSTIHNEWTQAIGTWSIDFLRLKQTDESLSNTNIYTSVAQTGSDVYMYEWDAIMDGAGGNRRGGLHFFCDDAAQTNRGNSYFAWFRVDGNKMQIYKVTNNVFSLKEEVVIDVNSGQQYNNKVTYNPSIGEIKVYRDNQFIGSWTDPSPITSGNSISLRSGNALMYYDNVRVYKGRNATETLTVGVLESDYIGNQNPEENTPSAVINSIVVDNADFISLQDEHFVNIDWSAPSTVSVIDSLGIDIDTTYGSTQLIGSWTKSTDLNSGINNYWYAIGDSTGANNIVDWTSSGLDTSVVHLGLNLVYGTTYFFSVKVTNGGGLTSSATNSDGQLVLAATSVMPVSAFNVNDLSSCSNQVLDVENTSLYATSYLWEIYDQLTSETATGLTPDFVVNTAGSYGISLTVTNAEGSDVSQQIIEVRSKPIASFSASDTLVDISNGNVEFTNDSQFGDTYLWDFGDGTTSTDHTSSKHYSQQGLYAVALQVTNSCGHSQEVKQDYILVTNKTGIDNYYEHSIKVFPNPTTGLLFLEYSKSSSQNLQFEIWDITGKKVYVTSLSNSVRKIIELNNVLSIGLYQYKFVENGTILKTDKFMLTK
jgi:PKD repeat protein/N-acetyl-anhydromuramyl-L-alanine amidase AmpD